MEDLQYNQYFHEDSLTDVTPLMLVKILLMKKLMILLWKEVKIQITIHPLQFMLTFHNIMSKR